MKNDIPSSRGDEDIQANKLAKTIASESRTTSDKLKDIPVTPGNYQKFQGASRRPLPKGILWGVAGLIVIFVGGSIVSYYIVRKQVVGEISARADALAQGVNDLQNLDLQSAQAQFTHLNNSPDLGAVANALGFLFQGKRYGASARSAISPSNSHRCRQTRRRLQSNALEFIGTGNGTDTSRPDEYQDHDLAAIDADSNTLAVSDALVGNSRRPCGCLSAAKRRWKAPKFSELYLSRGLPRPAPHHLLVMLQNLSEEKPAGGFLGSYADVTIASGSITNISVHDIADVDSAFKPNIVPPVPLQLETPVSPRGRKLVL